MSNYNSTEHLKELHSKRKAINSRKGRQGNTKAYKGSKGY